jgi:fibronectin-binding autotransporter adhesin
MKNDKRGGSPLAGITVAVIILASTAGCLSAFSRIFQASVPFMTEEQHFQFADEASRPAFVEAPSSDQAFMRMAAPAWFTNAMPAYSSGRNREMWYLSLDSSGDRRLTFAESSSANDTSNPYATLSRNLSTTLAPVSGFAMLRSSVEGMAAGPAVPTAVTAVKTFDGGVATTGTSWNVDANWTGDVKPGSADQALLDNSVLASLPAIMSLDAAFTIQSLVLNSANSVSITANASTTTSRTLTLNGDGTGTPVLINVTGGGSLNLVSSSGTTGSLAVALGASGQFNVDSLSTLTVGGVISGSARSLEKTGTGTLVLNGTNTFSGGFTLTSGTVQDGNTSGFGTGTLTLAGGTVQSAGTNATRTVGNTLSITGDTTFGAAPATTGHLDFTGTKSTTGSRILTFNDVTTVFSASALTLGGDLATQGTGGATFSGGINLNGADRIITGGMTSALTISGGITGTGNVTLDANSAAAITVSTVSANNSGTITNAGTGSGTTTISGGVGSNVTGITENSTTSALTISGALAVNSSGTTLTNSSGTKLLTLSGGTTGTGNLILNNNSATDAGITLSSTSLNHTGTITNSGSGTGSTIISAVIGSNVTGVTENSSTSTLLLSGQHTYSGPTNLTLGGISLGSSSTLASGALTSGPVGTGTFHIGSGTNSTTLSTNVSSGTTRTVQNNISLDGDVTFAPGSGQTTGRIALDVFTGLTVPNTFVLTRTNQLTVSTGETVDLIGSISGTGFGITKLGPGTLNLGNGSATDANANTYTGLTTVSGGVVNLRKAAGTDAIAGDLLIDTTGTVALGNSNQIKDTSNLTVNGGGTFDLSGKSEAINALNGSGTITNNSTLSPTTSTLTTGSNNGGGAFSGTLQNGSATKVLALTKTGSGILLLTGSNAYTGDTTIKAGELELTGAGSLLSSSTIRLGDTTGSNSAMFTFGNSGGGMTLANSMIVQASSGGARTILGLATSGNTNTYSGNITMNTDLTLQSAALGSTVANGPGTFLLQGGIIDVGSSTLVVNSNLRGNNADTYSIQGIVWINELLGSTLATGGGVVKDGSGTLILQGTTNTYTGTDASNLNNTAGTKIGGGILGIYGDGSLGLAPTNAANNVYFIAPGTNTNTDSIGPTLRAQVDNITLAATRNVNIASGITARFDSNGFDLEIDGNINGAGNLNKVGPGALILTNANSYTGTTTVSAGQLLVTADNSLGGTSGITVNSGGTLFLANPGTNSINDNATMGLNGGTFVTGGMSEHGAANNDFGIGPLTLQSSSIIDLGNGSSILAFANSALLTGDWNGTLSIYNWSGTAINGNGTDQLYFGNNALGLTPSQLAQISFYSDNGSTFLGVGAWGIDLDGEVVPLTAVPEPSTWIGAALALGAVGFTQRRKVRGLFARA